uniref:Winged helix-turn helix n=2 Tax=Candidatus Kentrum eta TaxID=2126337 RepID=A0A450VMK2_9GAMM|nr:MAG: Winged helix-turn helix [Candidatus Kentron sp. H]VFK09464.1 MAG: Winged helix-turn helix [Candidatus Kentron sp. H]
MEQSIFGAWKHRNFKLSYYQNSGTFPKLVRLWACHERPSTVTNRQWRTGIESQLNKDRRAPNLKNRIDEHTEEAVVQYAIDYPAHGQARASNELRKPGIFVSWSGVRSIWLRHGLACFKKRLCALEEKIAKEGITLTEAQVTVLERKKHDDQVSGEIETEHPGYLGSQDTFYVGTLKGVRRIYQQTLVDTYSKVAFAKLYTTKTPITAADLLNDRVLPFFESHGLPMLRILYFARLII